MRGGRTGGLRVLLLIAASLPTARLSAQSDPRLQTALRLAQEGRQDSAQSLVGRLIATLSPADSVYPEAVYTQAKLGTDARTITTSLQRVAVEYSTSPWADDALLLLTQFHFAQGDDAATLQAAERLRRDYPDSPLRARVALPAARAAFNLRDETRGCTLIREAEAGAGDDVEFHNQVTFYASRCAQPPPLSTDTGTGVRAYSVQVLAIRSAAQVDEMLTRLKVMGYDPRVVRDTSGLLKVRVGPYQTREAATTAQAQLRARLGGRPFVVEER
ncbi:MAG: SPOR domain-containing protein [Gemmatimonadales bacterium]